MRIALIDDEIKYLNEMKELLLKLHEELFPSFSMVIDSFQTGSSFLENAEKEKYQLVFMDIYIGDTNGISVAKQFREKDPECLLVFLTSSSDFMPEAFSCHAFEYITKPFSPEWVRKVLSDAIPLLKDENAFITLPVAGVVQKLPLSDILAVITDGHYLDISMIRNNDVRCRITINEFMKLANGSKCLLQINRGIIINMDYIDEIGDISITLTNGNSYPIQTKRKSSIKQEIYDYRFYKLRQSQTH